LEARCRIRRRAGQKRPRQPPVALPPASARTAEIGELQRVLSIAPPRSGCGVGEASRRRSFRAARIAAVARQGAGAQGVPRRPRRSSQTARSLGGGVPRLCLDARRRARFRRLPRQRRFARRRRP